LYGKIHFFKSQALFKVGVILAKIYLMNKILNGLLFMRASSNIRLLVAECNLLHSGVKNLTNFAGRRKGERCYRSSDSEFGVGLA
jgi:hypothetical protein